MRYLPFFSLLLFLFSACDTNSGALSSSYPRTEREAQPLRARESGLYQPSLMAQQSSFRPGIQTTDYAQPETEATMDTYLATAAPQEQPRAAAQATAAAYATPEGRWHGMRLVEE